MTVHRTKMLIAALGILAIGLTTGVGSRWLSYADAQDKRQVPDAALNAVDFVKGSPTRWEYKFEPAASESQPMGLAEVSRRLQENAAEGWDFCGGMEMSLSPDEFRKLAHGSGKVSSSGVYRVNVYKRAARADLKHAIDLLRGQELSRDANQKLAEELSRALDQAKRDMSKQSQYEKAYREALEKVGRLFEEKDKRTLRELELGKDAELKRSIDLAVERKALDLQERDRAERNRKDAQDSEQEKIRALEARIHEMQAEIEKLIRLKKPPADADMKKQIDQLKSDQAALDAFRAGKETAEAIVRGMKKDELRANFTYKFKSSVSDAREMIELAATATQKKFGKGAVRVEMDEKDAKSREIRMTGRPEAVKWMFELLRTLEN